MTEVSKTKRRKKAFPCPNCGTAITRAMIAGFIASQGAGRKKELTPCEFCKEPYGTVEMRRHIPRCDKNPNARKKPVKVKRKIAR